MSAQLYELLERAASDQAGRLAGGQSGLEGSSEISWDVRPEDAIGLLNEVVNLENRTQALRVELVSHIARSGVWADEGYPSADAYICDKLNVDRGAAKSDCKTSQRLGHLPELAGAFARGDVSATAVKSILAVGFKTSARAQVIKDFDAVFANIAGNQPLSVLKKSLSYWADNVDPLTTAKDEHDAHNRRYLRLSHLPDGCHVDGFLTHVQGIELATALNGIMENLYQQEHSAGGDEATTGVAAVDCDGAGSGEHLENGDAGEYAAESDLPLADDPATPTSRRRADAIVELAKIAKTAGGLPETGGMKPTVLLTAPVERLERHKSKSVIPAFLVDAFEGASGSDRSQLLEQASSNRLIASANVCEVSASNGPERAVVSVETAQRMTCDATISSITVDSNGLPLDVGRTTRQIPQGIRRALIIRDRGCIHPHCDRPAAWCDAHHVQHWAHGGDTALDNLVLLCEAHHIETHSYGHVITFDEGGFPRMEPNYFYDPDRSRSHNRRRGSMAS